MADEDEEKKPASAAPPPPDIVPPAAETEPGPAPDMPSIGTESDPLMYKSFPPPEPKPVGAISSGAFEIARASFIPDLPPASAGSSVPPNSFPEDLPPSTVIANAMGRNQRGLSLGAIVGIAAGVLVVAIGLALLLFR